MLKVSVIKDHTGSPVGVVLPFEIFRRLAEQAESALSDEDLAALVLATHDPNEETWPAALVNRLLDGENPLHVYRTYRGLSQKSLAEKAGCTANYISQLETGRRVMSPIMASSLANILGIDADDLIGSGGFTTDISACEKA